MSWIVAMTKPNCESIAEVNLRRQGFDCYLPRWRETHPNKKAQIRPLFPRYIFIFIDRIWYCLLGTRGISKVLMNDTGPQKVSGDIIIALKEREDHKGLISLEPKPKFLSGDRVRATEGPLAGQLLIYQEMSPHERVYALFNTMGRSVRVEIDENTLIAA